MSKKMCVGKKELKKDLCARFQSFITIHPPREFNRHLRAVFFDYLTLQAGTGFPADFDLYLGELYDLFELMDYADEVLES